MTTQADDERPNEPLLNPDLLVRNVPRDAYYINSLLIFNDSA